MNPIDYLTLAFDSIKERKGRSIGAIIGIIIAVVTLTIALGIGVAFDEYLTGMFAKALGPDLIMIQSSSPLTDADIISLSGLANVKKVLPVVAETVYIDVGEKKYTTIYGVRPEDLEYVLGAKPEDVVKEGVPNIHGTNVLVGKYVAYSLERGIKLIEVGQNIAIYTGKRQFIATVSGIVEAGAGLSIGFINPGHGIIVSLDTFFRFFRDVRSYNMIIVQVSNVKRIEETMKLIKAYLPEAQVIHLGAALEFFKGITTSIEIFLGAISGIGLLITGLWMFDTMTISVVQRTKEIGILKALGFNRKQIMFLFLSESFLISIIGSTIGIAITAVASQIMVIPLLGFLLKPSLRLWVIQVAIAVPLATNTLATLLPAYRAARLDPVEALRYE